MSTAFCGIWCTVKFAPIDYPSATLGHPFCPLFDFDADEYGFQMIDQTHRDTTSRGPIVIKRIVQFKQSIHGFAEFLRSIKYSSHIEWIGSLRSTVLRENRVSSKKHFEVLFICGKNCFVYIGIPLVFFPGNTPYFQQQLTHRHEMLCSD